MTKKDENPDTVPTTQPSKPFEATAPAERDEPLRVGDRIEVPEHRSAGQAADEEISAASRLHVDDLGVVQDTGERRDPTS